MISIEHSGGSGSAGHRDSKDSIQSHSDHGSHRESEAGANIDILSSRKNSSSAESCLSANSRSGSESAGAGVNNLNFPYQFHESFLDSLINILIKYSVELFKGIMEVN